MRAVVTTFLLALVLILASPANAEWFVVGAKVGAPFTEVFEAPPNFGINTSTTSFTIGPTAELRLPFGLGVEVDALYKRSRVSETPGSDYGANTWEFPLLAKYRLPGPGLQPYVAAGASFRKASELVSFVRGLDTSTRGFVAGAGLEIKIPKLRLQPEIRYTRWGSGTGPDSDGLLLYKPNQLDFLFGIVF